MQPVVRAMANPALAAWMRQLHPLRLQYELFADTNPAMAPVRTLAEQVRQRRMTAASDNPFVAMQEHVSSHIVTTLEMWRQFSESVAERTFVNLFGSPVLQAAVGIDPASAVPMCKAARNPLHRELVDKRIAELRARIPEGGTREAVIRALLYIGMPRNAVDERGFEIARRIRQTHGDMPLADFKMLVREQFNILMIDQDAALAAIPSMLPDDSETRRVALALIRQVLTARGELSDADSERLRHVTQLLDLDADGAQARAAQSKKTQPLARAS